MAIQMKLYIEFYIKRYIKPMLLGIIAGVALLCTVGTFSHAADTSQNDTPQADNPQILKVAYSPLANFFDYDEQGKEVGYGVDVLNEISKYTGIQFQYVKAESWEDTKPMLLEGKADIRMPGTMPSTPSTTLSYSNTSILDTYEAMLTLKSRTDLYYQDYDKIPTLKIAIVDSFYEAEDVSAYLSEIGITKSQLVFCTEYTQCYEKLKAGEVDALVTNIMDMSQDMKMLVRFNSVSNYVTTVKDSPYMNLINEAIAEIKIEDPTFFSDLYKEWFPEQVTIPLTAEEDKYLEGIDTLTFAFREDEGYLSHKTDGEYYGIYVEQAKIICEKLGKKFKAVSLEDCLDGKEQTDVYAGFFYDQNYAEEWHFAISAPISDINYYIVQKREQKFDPGTCRIAAIKKFRYTSDYLKAKYKDADFQYYDTYEECLLAVENGKADITIINNYIAEYYLGMYQYGDLSVQLSTAYTHMYCFATPEDNSMLASILTKGLTMVTDKEKSATYLKGQENKPKTQFLKGLLYKNPVAFVLVCAFIMAITIAVILLYLFSRRQKKQNLELERALSVKSDFMASMSHDMRTPMNGILGMIRLSKETTDIGEIQRNMKKAESAGEYMLSLINDTLDLQKLELRKLTLKKDVVNVREYYDDIFTIMKLAAEDKQVELQVQYIGIDPDKYIYLDTIRVKQILANIVSNAIKFTPEGGTVAVTVESLGEDHQILHRRYQVKDTGIGMSETFVKERLFHAYSQENNQLSPRVSGSGLGMAITKSLVELMGGHIEVDSELGEGTTFNVYLDIEKATPKMAQKEEQRRREKRLGARENLLGKHILLCEDHPLNAEIATKLLEKAGCKITWEADGALGVERFQKEAEGCFDVILMDIRMPNMDGLAATRAIRACTKADAKTIPIIAMTANAYDSDIQNCMDAGMNGHIAKPIDPQNMYATIGNCLK